MFLYIWMYEEFRTSLLKSTRFTALALRHISSAKPIELTVDAEGIATLTLNNKPVNVLSVDFLKSLHTSLDEIEKEKIKGVVLTSAIQNVFCAGLNLKDVFNPDVRVLAAMLRSMQDLWVKLFGSNFVTAAAINGHAPAGGCLLAMSCEYRAMVAGDYTIGLNETAIGLKPTKYFVETMKYTIGPRQAELALTTSKMFTPQEALKVGLVDKLAENQEECVEHCKNYIKKFTKIYPVARATTKQIVRGAILKKILDERDRDLNEQLKEMDKEMLASVKMYMDNLKQRKVKA